MNCFGGKWICLAGLALSACTLGTSAPESVIPAALPLPAAPSAESDAVRLYYARVQNDLLVHGLMRTDGGGPDTPYTSDMLARNFETVAFFDEHELGPTIKKSTKGARSLTRWTKPIRIKVEFGPSVPKAARQQDEATIKRFAARLNTVTGHPVSVNRTRSNFNVLVVGEDDRPSMAARFNELLPSLTAANRALLQNLPRDMHCLVVVSRSDSPVPEIISALAIVRAEHPDLLRKACFHEEIAQGMGLVNDSDAARPSIFNDDDEFALLTTHDEKLLNMLYDSRLSIGMSLEEARPIIRILAREQLGQNL